MDVPRLCTKLNHVMKGSIFQNQISSLCLWQGSRRLLMQCISQSSLQSCGFTYGIVGTKLKLGPQPLLRNNITEPPTLSSSSASRPSAPLHNPSSTWN